jgi:hypothetical protein
VVGSGIMHRLSWVAVLGLAFVHSSLAQYSVSVEKAALDEKNGQS